MQIRFGYVSNALGLYECSPAKTMTYTTWKKLEKQERDIRLIHLTRQNLYNTLRAIFYNIGQEIKLYRLSSSIVPLATHPEVDFPFVDIFKKELKEIGDVIKKYHLRVSFHPNQFTLFTSDKSHITENAVKDMNYHYDLLDAMGIANQSYINIHVGGVYGNKETAIERFHQNLKSLPLHVKQQMTLENDDKTYTVAETLAICQKEHIPLMFDYHHYMANQGDTPYEELLHTVFDTWRHTNLLPKVHISSPKSEKEFRSHADYVNAEFVRPFFDFAKSLGRDFDVMIEAKKKDLACLQLVEDLSKIRGYKRISGATLEIK